jgi:carbon storage regulator
LGGAKFPLRLRSVGAGCTGAKKSIAAKLCAIPALAKVLNCCGPWVDSFGQKETEVMLVLSRQSDEAIIIGDNIRVTIVEVRGDKVRIGIDAPRDVTVHRQEIYDAIRRDSEREARNN